MNWFNKIDERNTPPGLEADVLRLLPRATLIGVLSLCALSFLGRVLPKTPKVMVAGSSIQLHLTTF